LKIFREDINSINTRLAIIIGFDANLGAFISKLPTEAYFQISDCLPNLEALISDKASKFRFSLSVLVIATIIALSGSMFSVLK
jgi:hypothetical protein